MIAAPIRIVPKKTARMNGKKMPQPMRQSWPNVTDSQSIPSTDDLFATAFCGPGDAAEVSAMMRQASSRSPSRRRDSAAIWDCVADPSTSSGDSFSSSAAMDASWSRRGLSSCIFRSDSAISRSIRARDSAVRTARSRRDRRKSAMRRWIASESCLETAG